MAKLRFTDRSIKALKSPPPRQQIDVWSDSIKRFGIRVSWTGTKSWVIAYRHHKRPRRLTLGSYSSMTLAEATTRARKALTSVDDGNDPAFERAASRNAGTFKELTDEYLERHAIPKKRTWKEDRRVINRTLLPKFRHLHPREIARSDIRVMIESIYDGGAPIQATRVLALIRKIMNFGIERDWLEHNPCHQVKPPAGKEQPRDRVLNDDEIQRVWTAFGQQEPEIAAAFKLRLLTAQRGAEVLSMRWQDLDFDGGFWTIPSERAKNGHSHRVPIGEVAASLLKSFREWQLEQLPRINEGRKRKKKPAKELSEWVFPARRDDGSFLRWVYKATRRVCDISGISFRPHDLRRTAASRMTSIGVPRLTVSKILNHAEGGVTAIYDRHGYDDEKRAAIAKWERELARLVGKIRKHDVLTFPTRRAV